MIQRIREATTPEFPSRWAQFLGLWALGVAKPGFDLVSSGPEGLTQGGAGRIDVLVFILTFAVIVPTLLVLAICLAGHRYPTIDRGLFASGIGFLFGLVIWQNVGESTGELIRYGLALGCAGLFATAWLRFELVRNFALFLVVALPVVIISFTLSYPIKGEFTRGDAATGYGQASGKGPIIVIVLDEFSQPYLEARNGNIDRDLYPRFARLAEETTWYRNAFGAADHTARAVPAIMTGSIPSDSKEPLPPSSKYFPDNLCRILEQSGYRTTASEQITDLCDSKSWSIKGTTQLLGLGATGALPLPESLSGEIRDRLFFDLSSDGFRRLSEFTDQLDAEERSFQFLHVAVPHVKWEFLPNGQEYTGPSDDGFGDDGIWSDYPAQVDAALQRYALQTRLVDRKIGAMVDKLKSAGQWRDSTVVVTADHGLFFGAGERRRIATRSTAGQSLSVPMFVKFPGQTKGRVVSQPVETIDIAPTMLQIAGIRPPASMDGSSLLDATGGIRGAGEVRPAGRIRETGRKPLVPERLPAGFAELQREAEAARRLNSRLFGSGSFYAIGGHPGLLGRPISSVPDLKRLQLTLDDPDDFDDVDPAADRVPALVDGTVTGADLNEQNNRVAVSVDGEIRATARVWRSRDDDGKWRIAVVLPVSGLAPGPNEIKVFAING